MNCVLEGRCVKAFGKAVHALSRIGEQLWLEPTATGLALRSVNAAHSAYACFLFLPPFFQLYSAASARGGGSVKCKLFMKSLLALFRCLTSIERNVVRCLISVSAGDDRVMIQFCCRHGITKTHNLCYQESEALQAVFATHLSPNVLRAPARLLGDMVMHFPASQEEITLSLTPLRVAVRNYCDGGQDHTRRTFTEINLHPDEFDYFHFGENSDITFGLKELRGLLSFTESHCLPVAVHFSAAGEPVCFSVDESALQATVVLATLVDSDSRGPSQLAKTPPPVSPRCAGEGSCEADCDFVPALTELVASSQGSAIVSPAPAMRPLPLTHDLHRPVDESLTSAAATPAPSMMCSLLFGALSGEDARAADGPPVLAFHSDEDEDEDCSRGTKL